MNMPAVTYTDPQLYTCGGDTTKAWFVGFDITNNLTGEVRRPQYRGGINYYHTAADRQRAGKALIKTWKEKLESGWNPWGLMDDTPDKPIHLEGMTFSDALDFGLSKYKAARDTKRAYRTCVKFIKKAAAALHHDKIPAAQIKRQHIKLQLEYCTSKLGWTNAGHNKHLGYLHAILGSLIQWEILEYNPSDKIAALPVAETHKFVPLTDKEKQKLQEHLLINHYPFFVYLMVIYHTGMRPKEVLAMKISDVDLAGSTIKIIPDLEEENSKTKKIRIIPINKHLAPFFREMHLQEFPVSHYIFGSPFRPGGNRGKGSELGGVKGAKRLGYFTPMANRVKRDTTTRLWKTIVKGVLGIDKFQYAMKHTGGDDKILAGMDLDALRELYGHYSKFMTEKYASKIKEVYRARIMEHSPDFVPRQAIPT